MDIEAKEAAHLRLAIQLGIKSISDVIRWADSRIESTEQPDDLLLELSMMADSHPLDVMGRLGELSSSVAALDVVNTVLADAHASLIDDPSFGRPLARNLYFFYVENGYPKSLGEGSAFDGDYSLVDQGFGTEEEVYRHFLEYTGRFTDGSR